MNLARYDLYPAQRIKPKFLREVKTEALLVFVRITLEQIFNDKNKDKIFKAFELDEENDYVEQVLRDLLSYLKQHVVSPDYFTFIVNGLSTIPYMRLLARQEEPLVVYFNSIIRCIENILQKSEPWIPELLIFALLSEWILEEGKSMALYPFVEKIDYLRILDIFDRAMLQSDKNTRLLMLAMYQISSKLIANINNTTYKVKKVNKKR